jgi:uncharacterized protein DUF695
MLVACASQPKQDRGKWVLLETTEAGHRVIVLAIEQIPKLQVRAAFPWETKIRWQYTIDDAGMPSDEVLKSMYTLEDDLDRVVVSNQQAVLAMTRTGNGSREWTYYAKSREVVEREIKDIVKSSPASTIRVTLAEDSQWTSLTDVLSKVVERDK